MTGEPDPVLPPPDAVAPPLALRTMRPVEAVARPGVTMATMPDGTRVEYRDDGSVRRELRPDGTVLGYDASGRVVSELLPDGTTLVVHQDGSVTEQLPDHTVVEFDAANRPVREILPDHTVFTSFDEQGRPVTGTLPDGTGIRYEYRPDGGVLIRYSTGLLVTDDAEGRPIWERLPDGTEYQAFDAQGRPVAGRTPTGLAFSLTYDAQGDVTERFTDGSSVQTDPGGRTLRQVTADGTVFTQFDGSGRPTRGVLAGGGAFTLTYDAQGDVTEHFTDGSSVQTDPGGRTIREVSADGTTFTGFDGSGRPTEGVTSDGTHFTITYDQQGDVFEHLDDGTVVETDSHGQPIRTWLPDGTQITWAVDIPALNNAVGTISTEQDAMRTSIDQLRTVFTNVESIWDSPAGMSLHPLVDTFNTVTTSLMDLLDDALNRMRQAYQNYVSTESTNTSNLH